MAINREKSNHFRSAVGNSRSLLEGRGLRIFVRHFRNPLRRNGLRDYEITTGRNPITYLYRLTRLPYSRESV